MKLKYTLNSKNILTTCNLKKADLKNAMFYLYKEHDNTSFDIEYLNKDIDFESKIYKTESLKTIFKVYSNTTDVLITDVVLDDTPYYFEVLSSDGSYVNTSDISLKTPYESVEISGRVYTNTYFTNYEIFEGVFITSVPTIDTNLFNFKFLKDSIQISIKKGSNNEHFSRPFSTSVLSFKVINENLVRLPSFYINSKNNVEKYIAGDIVNLSKKEVAEIGGNYIKLKDYAIKTHEGLFEYRTNTIFLSDYYIESTNRIIEYTASRSSHDFEILSRISFKLNKGFLEIVEESDSDFSIIKKLDSSKFNLLANNTINRRAFKIEPTEFGLQFNKTSDFLKKMLTNFKYAKIKSPSQIKYLNINSKDIYQKNKDITDIEVVSREDLSDYLDTDEIFTYDLINKPFKKVSIDYTNTDYEVYYE